MTPVFRPRPTPLEPRAVVALDATVPVLARRLLSTPARLETVTVVSAPAVLVVLGPADALPWVPGVIYLGSEPGTPGLLLPTTKAPSVSLALVERAVRRAVNAPTGPLALVTMELVVPLARAARFSRADVQRLVEAA